MRVLCALLWVLLATPVQAQIYVKADAGGANNGTSWTDAYTDLQTAIGAASGGGEIWVAAGTYKPTNVLNRGATFQLVTGVAIYGGFAGTETMLAERDYAAKVTILSGDIGIENDPSDNSYHVVTGSGAEASAILDGFTITGGQADGANPDDLGGGIVNDDGRPTLRNLIFTDNHAGNGGAIMNRNNAVVEITNVVCVNNSATYGGAMSNLAGSDAVLTNVTVAGNTASLNGGGLSNLSANPVITNSIVFGNTSPTNPNVRNTGAVPVVDHSLIVGCGESGAYWDSYFGTDGGGNRDGDPIFVDLPGGDVRLTLGSPVVDAGDNAAANLLTLDLDGHARIFGANVDMGAYEVEATCPAGPVVYVDADAAGAGDGTSWADAMNELRDALKLAELCPSVTEVWVAEGTYKATPGADRSATFRLQSGLAVYGGFAGTEVSVGERDIDAHETTLSGDVGVPGGSDNSYHVVLGVDVDATAVLDGFTVTRGDGDDVRNGAGLLLVRGDAEIRNVYFYSNQGARYGGGVHSAGGGDPTFIHCEFRSNNAVFGGGISSGSGNPKIINSIFTFCWADTGGAFYSGSGNPTMTNCTLGCNGSWADVGCSMYFLGGSGTIKNTLAWGCNSAGGKMVATGGGASPVFSYCDIDGSGGSGPTWDGSFGVDGGYNYDYNPVFLNQCYDVHVAIGSVVTDAGDNLAPYLPATDSDGNPRIVDGTVDIGAYESQVQCPPGPVYYVDQNAGGANDGSSWTNAWTDLQSALQAACGNIDEVWVAAGTYTPTQGADRSVSFYVRSGLAVYGGFSGTETQRDQRDPVANVTILSGEIGDPMTTDDNSGHVVTLQSAAATTVIDGFTIRAGRATSGSGTYYGAAIYMQSSSPLLRDLKIEDCFASGDGGAVWSRYGAATLENVRFLNNHSEGNGGAIFSLQSNHVMTQVIFYNNSADNGGGIYNVISSPDLTNVTFYGCTALYHGGAVVNTSYYSPAGPSNTRMYNCIVWGCGAEPIWVCTNCSGAGIFTPLYSHSLIETSGGSGGGWDQTLGIDAGNNIDADPMFADAPNGDLHLLSGSPAIDTGTNFATYLPATDIDGNPRIVNGLVDMGVYEFDPATGIEDGLPHATRLRSIYPNPFNPSVTIAFELDRTRHVTARIYDVQGRRVAELLNEMQGAGPHELRWEPGNRVASGIYFLRLEAGDWQATRKLTLLK